MMRWKDLSIRHAAGFPPDRKVVLRPHPGLGDPMLGGPMLAGPGLGRAGLAGEVLTPLAARTRGGHSGERTNPPADGNSSPENSFLAQPSGTDGVPEDMATLVLDNSTLGAGSAARPERLASLDPSSDAAIMLCAAAGDESGFNYLAEKYHRPIIHFLFRMVRNQAVAEELAQEVFLRVYRSRGSYRAEAKFTTWLYRIATNLAVNYARDTRHERSAQTFSLDAPDEETGTKPEVAGDEPSAEQRLLREERMKAIRARVMALPERQRMAVVMHKYQGMDYREIGAVLKLSESAIKSLLFRAYQTLRETLKEFV
jgi:RNA polymerase sigma-70 factor (ECF subfamily)